MNESTRIRTRRNMRRIAANIAAIAVMAPAILVFNGNEDMLWVNFCALAYIYCLYIISSRTATGRRITRKIYKYLS